MTTLTRNNSRPWDGVSWIVRGVWVLGWMAMRSVSSVSQLATFRKKFPLPDSP